MDMQAVVDYQALSSYLTELEDNEEVVLSGTFSPAFLTKRVRTPPGIPNKTTKSFELAHAHIVRPKSRFGKKEVKMLEVNENPPSIYDDPLLHDIRIYTNQERKGRNVKELADEEDLVVRRAEVMDTVVNLMTAKPCFERNRSENKALASALEFLWPPKLVHALQCLDGVKSILPDLVTVAALEVYPETGQTVFGNQGLRLVLTGSLKPQTVPYLCVDMKPDDDERTFRTPTPLLKRKSMKIMPGAWLGTLRKIEGRDVNSKILTAVTTEPTQLLKIGVADYTRILEKIKMRLENHSVSVIQACAPYKLWPNMSLKKLAKHIEWQKLAVNSVIVNEGDVAPSICIMKKGSCDIYKHVHAIKILPNGARHKVVKSVHIGVMNEGDSFGEHSVINSEPFTCSVVTSTPCELGVIPAEKLDELDATTKALLVQSTQARFEDIDEEEVHKRFIKQEMDDDWVKTKQNILLSTLNYCGIQPGYGKWAK